MTEEPYELCDRLGPPASKFYGRTITAATIDDDYLRLAFDSGQKIAISDYGQTCCEHRYMRTDDDVQTLVGGKLARIEVKEAPDIDDEWGTHEVRFVEVGTDKGFITIANHNEHNGYYGGFDLVITEMKERTAP